MRCKNPTDVASPKDQRELEDELRRGLQEGLVQSGRQRLALDPGHQGAVDGVLGVHAEQGDEETNIPESFIGSASLM